MGGGALSKVQRGQPLNIRADDWNRIVDATRAFYEQQGPAPGRGPATVGGHRHATVSIPTDDLQPNAVNWIEFIQGTNTSLQTPFVPAVLEPYTAPLLPKSSDVVTRQ